MVIRIESATEQLKEKYQFQSSVEAFLIMTLVNYAEQQKNIASVSGKRPTRKLFCKVWTQTFGEEIDNVNQLVYGQAALGEDLYELCLKFHKAASATAKGEERKE